MHDKHVRMPMLTRIGKTTASQRQRPKAESWYRDIAGLHFKARYVFQRCFMLPNETKG